MSRSELADSLRHERRPFERALALTTVIRKRAGLGARSAHVTNSRAFLTTTHWFFFWDACSGSSLANRRSAVI
jgi:hypothetical protein